jgi:HAMP domain-containing protein
MRNLFVKLRIGEKIGIGFGLIGLLFLGVIWQYHQTLQRALSDYQQLQEVFGAKKSFALAIEDSILEARRAEKNFLLSKDERFVAEVAEHVARVLELDVELKRIDTQGALTGQRIDELIETYHRRFLAIAEAWRSKGLDHNSGLQGAFRDSVHQLEALAGHFEVGGLYLQLLQIRRGEKDLGLRRERQYSDKVLELVREFERQSAASKLDAGMKQQLRQEIAAYRDAFEEYARGVLAQQDIQGGKGSFRQAAHRIEALLKTHYIPDLGRNILQLRRREKDYLLRGDSRYVELARQEIERMTLQVSSSAVAPEEQAQLTGLLEEYQRNFLALMEQNQRIEQLQEEMREAVRQIAPMVRNNVHDANRAMQETAAEIQASSRADARLMLWIAAFAALLGIAAVVIVTLRIARPLRRMAGLLDQVAYEEPMERIPVIPGGRDEVNAMAASVNAMADHKAHFLAWWKSSMREAESFRKLQDVAAEASSGDSALSAARETAERELQAARQAKAGLVHDVYREIADHTRSIVKNAERLLESHPHGERFDEIKVVEQSGKNVLAMVDMLLEHEKPGGGGRGS